MVRKPNVEYFQNMQIAPVLVPVLTAIVEHYLTSIWKFTTQILMKVNDYSQSTALFLFLKYLNLPYFITDFKGLKAKIK